MEIKYDSWILTSVMILRNNFYQLINLLELNSNLIYKHLLDYYPQVHKHSALGRNLDVYIKVFFNMRTLTNL